MGKLKKHIMDLTTAINSSISENSAQNKQIELLTSTINKNNRHIEELKNMIESLKMLEKECEDKGKEIENLKTKLNELKDIEEKQAILHLKESKINDVIKRVESVYESFQCNLTCLVCGEISTKCTLCIPCGHCFCGTCISKYKACPTCTKRVI